jgi:CRISPR/Cas system-associated protein endoribonuclease Cas2
MNTKCQIKYFIFDSSIYRLFELNRGWKRQSLEIIIFVYVCLTWTLLELKTRFQTWITRNVVNGVILFHLYYLITLMAYLCSQWTTNVQTRYFMFDWSIYSLFVLNRSWKRESLQIMIIVYVCSTWILVELNTRFETLITKKVVNGLSLFHLYYLITLMAYLCSQWTPNVQTSYFMFDWSIYSLFVLNRSWRRESLQIMIFVYVCSTRILVEINTRFETLITRKVVNGLSLFRLYYLITLMAYLCSQWTPNVQTSYFMFDWSIYSLFVLHRSWKRESLQIMIFVYDCSTWILVELNTRFETWITWKVVNGVSLFHLYYLITLMAYLCSQWTPNFQIKYF